MIDSLDAYRRRDTLIMSGDIPEVTINENCQKIVINRIRSLNGLSIDDCDITTAYRVGKRPITEGVDRRKILFKISKPNLKNDILLSCRKNKPCFYINEQLTATRDRIMFEVRQLKRKFPSKILYTRANAGSVSVYIPSSDGRSDATNKNKRIDVNTRKQLESFITQDIGLPASDVLQSWPLIPGFLVSS